MEHPQSQGQRRLCTLMGRNQQPTGVLRDAERSREEVWTREGVPDRSSECFHLRFKPFLLAVPESILPE